MTVEIFRTKDYASADDGQDSIHAALFAHVGVTDPADWRSVALRLACMYAPDVLKGVDPCDASLPVNTGGRPKTWTDWHLTMVEVFVGMVREEYREGRLKSGFNLDTNIDACKFIVGKAPETQWMRDALGLKPGTSPGTLDNKRRDAIKLNKRATAHENL